MILAFTVEVFRVDRIDLKNWQGPYQMPAVVEYEQHRIAILITPQPFTDGVPPAHLFISRRAAVIGAAEHSPVFSQDLADRRP